MKHVKLLGLAAIAAMALMAFAAGSASATTLSSTNGNLPAGTVIHATLTQGTSAVLKSGTTTLDTCTASTLQGKTSNETGTAVSDPISTLIFGEVGAPCTNTTDTLTNGSISIEWSGGTNGSIVGSSSKVTVGTIFGTCTYGTSAAGILLGVFTGGNPARIAISATLPKIEGNVTCPTSVAWEANYTVTSATYNGTTYATVDVTN